MSRFGMLFKPLMWSMVLLLAAFAAGCGSGGVGETGSGPGPGPGPGPDPGPPTAAGVGKGVGDAGRGPAPVPLGTAGNFVILSANELTNAGLSAVTGNVGSTNARGSAIGLTCAEVNGTIYRRDSTGPDCMQTNAALLTVAKTDGDTAFNDSFARLPDYTDLWDGNIGGRNLGPATYHWSTPVQIQTDLTLSGGPNDVWIFQIAQGLNVSPGVRIFLRDGALPQNVYWAPTFDVELGATSQFKGILLPAAAVFMRNGASISGGLLAEGVHLDQNTVGP